MAKAKGNRQKSVRGCLVEVGSSGWDRVRSPVFRRFGARVQPQAPWRWYPELSGPGEATRWRGSQIRAWCLSNQHPSRSQNPSGIRVYLCPSESEIPPRFGVY